MCDFFERGFHQCPPAARARSGDHELDFAEELANFAIQLAAARGLKAGKRERVAIAGLAAGKAAPRAISGFAPRHERCVSHARDYAPVEQDVNNLSSVG